MTRHCTRCYHTFSKRDLAREQTRGMEADRKAMRLKGLVFRYYVCPECEQEDIYVEVTPLPGESLESVHQRTLELEEVARHGETSSVEVVVLEKVH